MDKKEMRAVLLEELERVMENDDSIAVIDADLAKATGTYPLHKKFPDRVFDVGIAEQNMASIAAGLASNGMTVFISTFTPFATRRICDQIAVSICCTKSNVKIIGTDPGIAAELNGVTHMSVEDIGVLRSIPNIVIYEAVDKIQFQQALPQIISHNGPVYIRFFRKWIEDVFDPQNYQFDLFKADILLQGTDISILSSGIMVQESLKAIELLKNENISAELINVHTIKPLDETTILKSIAKTKAAVTCENHNIIGGLGSAVAELLSTKNPTPLGMIGIDDRFGQVGMMPFLKKEYNMTAENIVEKVKETLHKKL